MNSVLNFLKHFIIYSMNITFPINNFSHSYNIISDLFEVEVEQDIKDKKFSFELDGNRLHCYENDSTQNIPNFSEMILEINYDQHSWSEILNRLELYAYRSQTNYQNFQITMDKEKHRFEWRISPMVRLVIHFKNDTNVEYPEKINSDVLTSTEIIN
jgi:hypothetical protein